MHNKVLVKLVIPEIDEEFDVLVPINIRIGMVINLLNESLTEITKGEYVPSPNRSMYNQEAKAYEFNALVRSTDIRNGSTVIFM